MGDVVFQIAKSTEGVQLLRWNKKLPSASPQDPLGLNLRVSARLTAQLLYCITSITPRARYYAFFPWGFHDYISNEEGKRGDRGRVAGVLAREKAMVLGAVLHHDGAPCAGGALGGSDEAIGVMSPTRKSYEIDSWEHLLAAEGQFGAAYKASLINLGLFEDGGDEINEEALEESEELDEAVQSIELTRLSERGKRLAVTYLSSVQTTRYVKERWALRSSVRADVLKEFGAHAGLCEIARKGAKDRNVIKEILFSCDRASTTSTHYRRRMSLLLMLDCVGLMAHAGVSFDRQAFSDLTYFGRVVPDEEGLKSVPIQVPDPLRDIAERWRIFHFHSHLTVALQSFLVSVVGVLRNHPGGIDRLRLLDEFQNSAVNARFQELFETGLPGDFLTLTPSGFLGLAGVSPAEALARGGSALRPLSIDSKFGERNLSDRLRDGEAGQLSGMALASMLLYSLLLRYQTTVDAAYDAWYQNHVQDRFADISVPGVLGTLRSEYGDEWWHRPNREILDVLVWRFVLLQHQTMSYERGFGGSAPLFHIDGTTIIGTETDFSDPTALNARFSSAIQILRDLGLIVDDDEQGLCLTSEGEIWSHDLLEKEAPR
jgi:hypothetical protein